ncbi:hypothetical protein KXW39_000375, partial [Aspergillus fumigatus]
RIRPAGEPQRPVRHRAGRHVRAPARRIAGRPGRDGFPGLCGGRRQRGRAQGRDAAHHGPHPASPAGPQAALPDGRGHARRPGRRRGPGRGHVRLCDADPQCAQRHHLHPLRRPEAAQRPPQERPAAPGCHLHLLRLCRHFGRVVGRWRPRRLQPRLPAPPGPLRRDAGPHADH